jgi:hypothetical protein
VPQWINVRTPVLPARSRAHHSKLGAGNRYVDCFIPLSQTWSCGQSSSRALERKDRRPTPALTKPTLARYNSAARRIDIEVKSASVLLGLKGLS